MWIIKEILLLIPDHAWHCTPPVQPYREYPTSMFHRLKIEEEKFGEYRHREIWVTAYEHQLNQNKMRDFHHRCRSIDETPNWVLTKIRGIFFLLKFSPQYFKNNISRRRRCVCKFILAWASTPNVCTLFLWIFKCL